MGNKARGFERHAWLLPDNGKPKRPANIRQTESRACIRNMRRARRQVASLSAAGQKKKSLQTPFTKSPSHTKERLVRQSHKLFLSSPKAMVGRTSEIKNTTEIVEIMAPSDAQKLHQVVTKCSNKWSVIYCGPRTQYPRLLLGSALCKFCPDKSLSVRRRVQITTRHTWRRNRKTQERRRQNQMPQPKQKSLTMRQEIRNLQTGFDKNRCKLCNGITDQPHWAATSGKACASIE